MGIYGFFTSVEIKFGHGIGQFEISVEKAFNRLVFTISSVPFVLHAISAP